MIIRHATIAEAAAVVELYKGYNRPGNADLDPALVRQRFEEIQRIGFMAVAVRDDEVIGTYSLYLCASLAHGGRPFAIIENVIVAAHVRRTGVGRALMNHARDQACERDCYKLMLATGSDSPRNRAFYESCGFVGNKIGFQVRFDARANP